jgi:AcrR family transcriptional regulator
MGKSSDTRGKVARRRREVQIARTREDILLAAARALGRRGFGSVSMQEIAADVGFTAPALYAYFASKEDIFSALRIMLHDELMGTFQPPPPEGQPLRRQLSILLGRQLEWADRRRDVFLAFVAMRERGEPVAFGTRAGDADDPGPRAFLRAWSAWLAQGAADHPAELGGCDPDEAASVLLGLCHGFLLRWLLRGSSSRLADDSERILDLFFHGVLGASTRGSRRSHRRTAVRRAHASGESQS